MLLIGLILFYYFLRFPFVASPLFLFHFLRNTNTEMKKNIFTILQYISFLGFGIFLVWWSIKNIDAAGWNDIKNSLAKVKYYYIFPVAGLLLLSHWIRALRWKLLMEPLGYHPKKVNTFLATMIGYLANLAVPRLGEVLKCTIIARYDNVPAQKLIGTMLLERIVDVLCLIIVFVFILITQSDLMTGFFQEIFQFQNNGAATDNLSPLVIIVLVLIFLTILAWILFKKFSKTLIVIKLTHLLQGVWQGLMSIRYVQKKKLFFVQTLLMWFMYYASTHIGFWALEETKHFGTNQALAVLAFGSIGLIITPGGLGGYPFMVQQTLLLYGLTSSIGWAFGMLTWLAQTVVVVIFGLLSFVLLPYFNKNKNAATRKN